MHLPQTSFHFTICYIFLLLPDRGGNRKITKRGVSPSLISKITLTLGPCWRNRLVIIFRKIWKPTPGHVGSSQAEKPIWMSDLLGKCAWLCLYWLPENPSDLTLCWLGMVGKSVWPLASCTWLLIMLKEGPENQYADLVSKEVLHQHKYPPLLAWRRDEQNREGPSQISGTNIVCSNQKLAFYFYA